MGETEFKALVSESGVNNKNQHTVFTLLIVDLTFGVDSCSLWIF